MNRLKQAFWVKIQRDQEAFLSEDIIINFSKFSWVDSDILKPSFLSEGRNRLEQAFLSEGKLP